MLKYKLKPSIFFEYVPFQMVYCTFSGLKVKLKSSCDAGRLRSFVHFLERNLQQPSIVMKTQHPQGCALYTLSISLELKPTKKLAPRTGEI